MWHTLGTVLAQCLNRCLRLPAGVEGVGTADSKVALYEGEGGERGVLSMAPLAGALWCRQPARACALPHGMLAHKDVQGRYQRGASADCERRVHAGVQAERQ